MSSRYDNRTTTFSPEGRLYQVEYATEAIGQAGAAVGIMTKDGIVLATERRVQNQLLDQENPRDKDTSGEKVYKIDGHIAVAVAGITSDANILINHARVTAQRHTYAYQEPIPAEELCQLLCDLKQGYTQYGGVRPFGVSFLLAAWDRYHGFQLYHTEPSGIYNAWKAQAIGQGDGAAQSLLKQEWSETLDLKQGTLLALKVLGKTLDTAQLSADRIEVATLSKSGTRPPLMHILTAGELKPLIVEADKIRADEEREREEKQKL